jgi:membrane protein YqaA with SNARE-associated domain
MCGFIRCAGTLNPVGGKRVLLLVMKHIAAVLITVILKLGGLGLLVLGILDSSFLVAPLGNDLLVIGMTARRHSVGDMLYYALMSSVGSVLGVMLIDLVVRRLGEEGLEKHMPRKQLAYVEGKVRRNAAWALAVAALAPPPFPFTAFIVATSALQYPRRKMYTVVGLFRMVRFTGLGVLALFFGRSILHWFRNPIVEGCFIGLLVVAVLGSVISVYGWIKRSRSRPPNGLAQQPLQSEEPAAVEGLRDRDRGSG